MALGNFGEDSDLDFLIVKDDPRRPLETEQELHRIIDYKIASDFIIVTPNEFQERIQNGDFFMEEILKTGKIIYG
jgi:predicted nucleotidyltransferase